MGATDASPLRNFFFRCLMTNCSLMRPEVVDAKRRRAAVESLRAARVTLPRLSELAEPARTSSAVMSELNSVGPDEPDERNLWRVHWFNDASRTERGVLWAGGGGGGRRVRRAGEGGGDRRLLV